MNAIFERKSIRKYTTQPLTDEQIDLLLRAAMSAPSARNQQPWEFIVAKERATLDKIMAVHPYAQMLKEAPLAIAVCGNTQRNYEGADYWVVDCAAAVENILIQATEMGLGSVWLGVFPRADRMAQIADLFELPAHVIPHAIVAIGYADENPSVKDKFKKDRIHFEKW